MIFIYIYSILIRVYTSIIYGYINISGGGVADGGARARRFRVDTQILSALGALSLRLRPASINQSIKI